MAAHAPDIIPLASAATLPDLFQERVRRSAGAVAYLQYAESSQRWEETTWEEMARQAARWRAALQGEGLVAGERVALQLRNCREWALFDVAAQSLGLVTVPLYTNDRPENLAYILRDAGARLLLIENTGQWQALSPLLASLPELQRVVCIEPIGAADETSSPVALDTWLPAAGGPLEVASLDPQALATLVYTSGTTGRSKGVMLSHRNILWNVQAALHAVPAYPKDRFLSFLPLSHTLERTAGYYLPIAAGSSVAFNRSIPQLGEDLQAMRPTVLMAVPRIFERVYARIQAKLADESAPARFLFEQAVNVGWKRFVHRQGRGPWSPDLLWWPLLDRLVAARVRARLGGRLRVAVCGGAPLPSAVARVFIGLGVPLVQGYGLTETSPVIAVNTLEDNIPESVGPPLDGVEVRIGEDDELLTRSPSLMLGYWNDPQATARMFDTDGWLHTGDKARIERNHIFITGRLKEILVLSNGEKVAPADLEMAIAMDALCEQVLVIGEGRPYLGALLVLDQDELVRFKATYGLPAQVSSTDPRLHEALLARVGQHLGSFPGHVKIPRVAVIDAPWTVDNGLMTPTMKLRRSRIMEQYSDTIERLYTGH